MPAAAWFWGWQRSGPVRCWAKRSPEAAFFTEFNGALPLLLVECFNPPVSGLRFPALRLPMKEGTC